MRGASLLASVTLVACTSPPPTIMGYQYFPVVQGTLTNLDAEEALVVLAVGSEMADDPDCATGYLEVVEDQPPRWAVGRAPQIQCGRDEPALRLYDPTNLETTFDWPAASGTYAGAVYQGDIGPKPFEFEVSIEEDEGNLTPIPEDRLAGELEATSEDYFRRYRITATIDCEETELPCQGTWELDVTYEEPRERVRWLYPIEE